MMTRQDLTKAGVATTALLAVVLIWRVTGRCPADEKTAHTREPLPTADEIAKLPPDGGKEFNRLIHEKSPYLLQHARNPVNWYPWGPEAFAKARKENKPVFLSVGYSTCHWCHVMERESFERDDVAKILNEHYVAIKVDREERPDVDQIYMLATQMLTGRGGWPNSLWLTPDGRPWYAGTYFPREDRQGMVGFKSVLTQLAEVWRTRRTDVDANAKSISEKMKRYSTAGASVKGAGKLSHGLLETAAQQMRGMFDPRLGGFGRAPKFPPHGALRLLFAEYSRTGNRDLLKMATVTLDAMARGGIHDHVAGGFHRYSTDAYWLLPHFEKMLYDNAQLSRAYVDGFVATKDGRYRHVAERTYDWVLREMTDPKGAFHSALDADSEGEEGKFYVWEPGEIIKILGKSEGELFCRVFNVVEGGNFSDQATGKKPGTSIPHLARPLADVAGAVKVPVAELHKRLAADMAKLLAVRIKRIWPHRDDKVLVSWNALMIGSLAYGGKHLERPDYIAAAEKAADFILTRMRKKGRLLRTYRQGAAKLNAYLDDYAFLADALVELHQVTGKPRWLDEAAALADTMIKFHKDPAGGGFYFTSSDHEELLNRVKDPTDRAVPAGNAVAAHALVRLGRLTGKTKYLDLAEETLQAFHGLVARSPGGMEHMLLAVGAYLDAARPAATAGGPKPDVSAGAPRVAVDLFASRLTVRPGGTIDLAIRLTIDKGWHVNSNEPLDEDLVATSLGLATKLPATLGGITYTKPSQVKLGFSDDALSVYEGTVWIRATLTLKEDARAGAVLLPITVESQACSDTACLAPEIHRLGLNVTIDPKAKNGKPRHPSVFGAK